MKKTLTLSETDIKAVIAEKFKVNADDVTIWVDEEERSVIHDLEYVVSITVESEVQNYDL